jgi:hypothetical protein
MPLGSSLEYHQVPRPTLVPLQVYGVVYVRVVLSILYMGQS